MESGRQQNDEMADPEARGLNKRSAKQPIVPHRADPLEMADHAVTS